MKHFRTFFLLIATFLMLHAAHAVAATFTVNSTIDADDAAKGDGICLTASGLCTLRAAISEANASFGSGPHTVWIPPGTYVLTGAANEGSNVEGDLDVLKPMTITGVGVDSTIIDGNGVDRVFDVGSASIFISNLTVRNGKAPTGDNGGGINYTGGGVLTLSNMKITGCFAYDGGGVLANGGNLSLTNLTISNCSADRKGGGVFVNSGDMFITNATFSNNSAVMDGGGIHNQTGASGVLTNVTISGNSTPGLGGGFYNQSGTGPTFVNSTIAYNSAGTGGGLYGSSGNILLKNSIVAHSSSGGNCSGNINSQGYNLDSGNSCPFAATGDRKNIDPKLAVLQNYGGGMLTHALLIGSPAIDAATAAGAPATDQRGISRPQGGGFDIGSFEGGVVAYQPDAQVRLASEGVGSYLTDNVYEASASAQTKNGEALSGATASYRLRFQNDGNVADSLTITGTGSGSGFTIQYIDESLTDRTDLVRGAGYSTGSLAPGASKEWTMNVTPSGDPAPVPGGTSYNVFVTATSANDGNQKDQVLAVTTSTSPRLSLVKVSDKATTRPGEDITYTTSATNDSSTSAFNVILVDQIPANTAFKVGAGNPSFDPVTSGLTCTFRYSTDNGVTWDYTPASGGCSAPAPFDYCVTHIKWITANELQAGKNFSVGFMVGVR